MYEYVIKKQKMQSQLLPLLSKVTIVITINSIADNISCLLTIMTFEY